MSDADNPPADVHDDLAPSTEAQADGFDPSKTQEIKPLTAEDVLDVFLRFQESLHKSLRTLLDQRDEYIVTLIRDGQNKILREYELWSRKTAEIESEVDAHDLELSKLRTKYHELANMMTPFRTDLDDLKRRIDAIEKIERRDTDVVPPDADG